MYPAFLFVYSAAILSLTSIPKRTNLLANFSSLPRASLRRLSTSIGRPVCLPTIDSLSVSHLVRMPRLTRLPLHYRPLLLGRRNHASQLGTETTHVPLSTGRSNRPPATRFPLPRVFIGLPRACASCTARWKGAGWTGAILVRGDASS